MFLNCFSYPRQDQEMYDEEHQVQRIHVNAKATESSQYQTYSQNSEIITRSGKHLNQSLTFKKRGRPKKYEDDDVEWSDTATNLVIDFWQVQEILYNAKQPKYHIREGNSCALSIVQQNMSEQGYEFTTAQTSCKLLSSSYFCKERGKVTEALRKAVAERINFIKVNGDFMST